MRDWNLRIFLVKLARDLSPQKVAEEGKSPHFTKISLGEILKFGQIFQSLNGYISEKPSIHLSSNTHHWYIDTRSSHVVETTPRSGDGLIRFDDGPGPGSRGWRCFSTQKQMNMFQVGRGTSKVRFWRKWTLGKMMFYDIFFFVSWSVAAMFFFKKGHVRIGLGLKKIGWKHLKCEQRTMLISSLMWCKGLVAS